MADAVRRKPIILTYEDYLTLPSDGKRYEILEGELAVTPSPSFRHQEVSRNLEFILFQHIKKGNLGKIVNAPMDVILSNTSIAQPDLLYISSENSSIITGRGVEGAPDLVVEILSPGTARYDRVSKMQIYARHGVKWYWLVEPLERKLEEYRLEEGIYSLNASHGGEDTFVPGLFPGLDVYLRDVWE